VPEALAYFTDYNVYEGWYFVRTTADCYYASGELKDQVHAWLQQEFCEVVPGAECADERSEPEVVSESEEEPEPAVLAMQGFTQHPDDSYTVSIDLTYDATYVDLVYCAAKCYDELTYTEWQVAGYDGVTDYSPVAKYGEYDVGANGGQFMYVVNAAGRAAYDALS